MNVNVTGPFVYFTIPIFGGIPITQTTVSSLLITVALCLLCVRLGKGLQKRPAGIQVLLEKGVGMMHGMVIDTMGPHNAHWTPFIIVLFVSSICGSLIGMTGFLRSTTADLSTTLTWSIMVSVIIWYNSIKNFGFLRWLKGFTEPIFVMTPMNLVSEIAQPISLAFRHFGNVAAGNVITTILYTALSAASVLVVNLIASSGVAISIVLLLAAIICVVLGFTKKKLVLKIVGFVCMAFGTLGMLQVSGLLSGVPILALGIPAVLSLYFDLFSGFIQALVFSLLSMVYISNACPPPADQAA